MADDIWFEKLLDDYKKKGTDPPIWLITQTPENAFDALKWLHENPNKMQPFASNMFNYKQTKQFIKHLYKLGALHIKIGGVYSEDWRLTLEGGPYADILFVLLPEEDNKQKKIHRFLKRTQFKPDELSVIETGTKWLRLWWD